MCISVVAGSLEVKFPTIWTDEMGRVREEKRREEKKEHQKRESLRRKKIQVREKVGQLRNTVFSQWFVAFEGRKVGSLKRRVRSYVVRWEMKSCTRLWRKAIVETSATALCGTTGISLRYQRSCEIVGLSCVLEWILCLYKYESPRGSLASFHGKWFGPGTGDGPLLPVSNVWKERPWNKICWMKGRIYALRHDTSCCTAG